jgi:hypothetical protein
MQQRAAIHNRSNPHLILILRSFDCMPARRPVPRPYHLSKIMVRVAYCLLLSFSTTQGFQPQDSVLEKDVYAIYSLMLTNPKTSHGADQNERYLIATTTTPGHPEEPCIRPPKEREADFREVLADYKRRKSIPRELKPAFSAGKPYELLSDEEAREFVAERRLPIPGEKRSSNQRFLGVTDLFTLSDVYFDQRRTLALIAISSWCGSLCALHQWKVFQKLESGKWEEQRGWVGCVTMARN